MSRDDDTAGRTDYRVTSAAMRVERTTRERHNVTPAAAVGQPDSSSVVIFVVEVTGSLSPDSGLHPAKLHVLDSTSSHPAWQDVTGDFWVMPLPDQSLNIGEKGVALLVGFRQDDKHQGEPVYSLGEVAAPDCRKRIANLSPTDKVIFDISTPLGLCSEIETKSIVGYPTGDEVWLSAKTFKTLLGDTKLKLYYSADGQQSVSAVGPTSGSGTATEVPLTPAGCGSGCVLFLGRPLKLCDSYPITDCDQAPGGAPKRYSVYIVGGTGQFAAFNGTWDAVGSSGCVWTVTTGTVTVSVEWILASAGNRALRVTVADSSNGATFTWTTASESFTENSTGCSTMPKSAWDTEVNSGTGDLPTAVTVSAKGPCILFPCTDNSFSVCVSCGGLTVSCGAKGPFPDEMCVALSPILTAGDPVAWGMYGSATFSNVTVRLGASYPTIGAVPPIISPAGATLSGFTTWGSAHGSLSWVGFGTASGMVCPRTSTAYTAHFIVEIYFDNPTDCNATIRLTFPAPLGWTDEACTGISPPPAYCTGEPWFTAGGASGAWGQTGGAGSGLPPDVPWPLTTTGISTFSIVGAPYEFAHAVTSNVPCPGSPPGPSPPPPPGGPYYCVNITSATPSGPDNICVPVGTTFVLQISSPPGGTYSFTSTSGPSTCSYDSNVVGGPYATEADAVAGCGL